VLAGLNIDPRPREPKPESDSDFGEIGRTSDLGKRARNVGDMLSALAAIPHDEAIDRDMWVKLGGAVYAGSGGSERGHTAFIAWSETWYRHGEDPDGHRAAAEELWESFAASPPRAVGAGTVFQLGQQHGWTWPKEPVAVGGFVFKSFAEVQITPTRDFVEGLLETDSVVVVYGPPGSAKTFWLLDLMLHVAWGKRWFGRDVEQGPALLFALESQRGVERRIAAFRKYYRLNGKDLSFHYTAGPVDLSDDTAVNALIRAIRAKSRALGRRIKIVAIDTLAAALGTHGDENSAEVMNPVMAACHRIREATGGCCLLLVHHTGKNALRGPRGFSGIGATVSTLIEIEGTDNRRPRRVVVRKQRDLERCDDMFYRLKVVELGIDPKHLRPITSCVVVPILGRAELAAAKAQTKLAHLSPQHRLALDALGEALQRHGRTLENGRRVTNNRTWRAVLRDRLPPETSEEAVYKALQRARQVLLTAGLIGAQGSQVWLQTDAVDDDAESVNTDNDEDDDDEED
jgi:KaiC/GvpD/RAD55 family RecA-like ATPase